MRTLAGTESNGEGTPRCVRAAAELPGARIMKQTFTVIIASDPDPGLMEAFARELSLAAAAMQRRVTLLVVDAAAAFPDAAPNRLMSLGSELPAFGIEWLPQSEATNKARATERALAAVIDAPVVLMDADMISNVPDIGRFLEWHANGAEVVFSWRVRRHGVVWWRRFLTRMFNSFVRIALGTRLHDINSPMVSLSANALNLMGSMRHRIDDRISSRIGACKALVDQAAEVPIETSEVEGRVSTYSFWGLISVGIMWVRDIAMYRMLEGRYFSRRLGD